VLDYEARFREKVIEPFARSYVAGETPIPCVACNQHIKFADLFDTARDLGAHVLATGHYISSRADGHGGRALYRAADADRDQSYFLFATTSEQLELLRFPLGDMPKSAVRDLAREFGLAVANKPDSQDICFVPSGRYTDVIARMAPESVLPGDIVHMDGRVMGRHNGLMRYTVGQRRGLGLSQTTETGAEPLYVLRLDAKRNEVIVGPREALATRAVHLRDVNWIGEGELADLPPEGREIAVRLRSTRPPAPALLQRDAEGRAVVELAALEAGVSPGQACVFYESAEPLARVLGGGFIIATDMVAPSISTLDSQAAASA
jgi:tRNA-specific 2-thiouridylase